jgi:hypothetical protein
MNYNSRYFYATIRGKEVYAMSVTDEEVVKKDKRSKTHHGSPRVPEVVLLIIEWRDSGMTWQAIGSELRMTRAGVRHQYMKWYEWYTEIKKENENVEKENENVDA